MAGVEGGVAAWLRERGGGGVCARGEGAGLPAAGVREWW